MNTETPKEWTVFLYERRDYAVRCIYNRQQIVRAETRTEALAKAQQLEHGETRLIGVSLVPADEHRAANAFNWKWK